MEKYTREIYGEQRREGVRREDVPGYSSLQGVRSGDLLEGYARPWKKNANYMQKR